MSKSIGSLVAGCLVLVCVPLFLLSRPPMQTVALPSPTLLNFETGCFYIVYGHRKIISTVKELPCLSAEELAAFRKGSPSETTVTLMAKIDEDFKKKMADYRRTESERLHFMQNPDEALARNVKSILTYFR